MFIVFEGLDGSGKSTQAKKLHDFFLARGENCLLTCEPTHGTLGSLARKVTKGELRMEGETLALLFAADRHGHYVNEIAPFLQSGGVVVCDRYYYSNLAYQGACVKSMERIFAYNQVVMENPPDIVFFLKTEPLECLRRLLASRPDASIYENEWMLETLSRRYTQVFDIFTRNVENISGDIGLPSKKNLENFHSGFAHKERVEIIETSGKNEEEVHTEICAVGKFFNCAIGMLD